MRPRLTMPLVLFALLFAVPASALLYMGNDTYSGCGEGSGRVKWVGSTTLGREWVPVGAEIAPHSRAKMSLSSIRAPPLDSLRILNNIPFVPIDEFSLELSAGRYQIELKSAWENPLIHLRGSDPGNEVSVLCASFCQDKIMELTRTSEGVEIDFGSGATIPLPLLDNIVHFASDGPTMIRLLQVPFLAIRDTAFSTRFNVNVTAHAEGAEICMTYWRRSSRSPHAIVELVDDAWSMKTPGYAWHQVRMGNLTEGLNTLKVVIHNSPDTETPPNFSFVLLLSTVCDNDFVLLHAHASGCVVDQVRTHLPAAEDQACTLAPTTITTCECFGCSFCTESGCDCEEVPNSLRECPFARTSTKTTKTSTTPPAPAPVASTTSTPATTATTLLTPATTIASAIDQAGVAVDTPQVPRSVDRLEGSGGTLVTRPFEHYPPLKSPPRAETSTTPAVKAPSADFENQDVVAKKEIKTSSWDMSLEMNSDYVMICIAGGAAFAISVGAIFKCRCAVRPWMRALACACRRQDPSEHDLEAQPSATFKKRTYGEGVGKGAFKKVPGPPTKRPALTPVAQEPATQAPVANFTLFASPLVPAAQGALGLPAPTSPTRVEDDPPVMPFTGRRPIKTARRTSRDNAPRHTRSNAADCASASWNSP